MIQGSSGKGDRGCAGHEERLGLHQGPGLAGHRGWMSSELGMWPS